MAWRFVADADMDDLATIEFAPPKGIDPWEAQVLLRERVDDATVEAWFSGLTGSEAVQASVRAARPPADRDLPGAARACRRGRP